MIFSKKRSKFQNSLKLDTIYFKLFLENILTRCTELVCVQILSSEHVDTLCCSGCDRLLPIWTLAGPSLLFCFKNKNIIQVGPGKKLYMYTYNFEKNLN